MFKRNLILAGAFILAAQSASALTAAELAASLTAEGYGYIQIKTGTTQIKAQAIKDGQKVESIYDAATGAVLKTEIRAIGTVGAADPGVQLRDVARDFVRVNDDGTVARGRDHGEDHGPGRGRGRDARVEGSTETDADTDSHEDRGPRRGGEGGAGGGEGGGRGRG